MADLEVKPFNKPGTATAFFCRGFASTAKPRVLAALIVPRFGGFLPRYKHVALFAVFALLSGCTVLSGVSSGAMGLDKDPATEEARNLRDMLVGKWYRSQPASDGGSLREIAIFKKDGTYRFEFRLENASGETEEFGSIGFWGISGGIHFTIERVKFDERGTFAVDPADPDHYLAYRVLQLSPQKFTHKALVTGNVFTLERVPDDFESPELSGD